VNTVSPSAGSARIAGPHCRSQTSTNHTATAHTATNHPATARTATAGTANTCTVTPRTATATFSAHAPISTTHNTRHHMHYPRIGLERRGSPRTGVLWYWPDGTFLNNGVTSNSNPYAHFGYDSLALLGTYPTYTHYLAFNGASWPSYDTVSDLLHLPSSM
jgi:hypothetical protein